MYITSSPPKRVTLPQTNIEPEKEPFKERSSLSTEGPTGPAKRSFGTVHILQEPSISAPPTPILRCRYLGHPGDGFLVQLEYDDISPFIHVMWQQVHAGIAAGSTRNRTIWLAIAIGAQATKYRLQVSRCSKCTMSKPTSPPTALSESPNARQLGGSKGLVNVYKQDCTLLVIVATCMKRARATASRVVSPVISSC